MFTSAKLLGERIHYITRIIHIGKKLALLYSTCGPASIFLLAEYLSIDILLKRTPKKGTAKTVEYLREDCYILERSRLYRSLAVNLRRRLLASFNNGDNEETDAEDKEAVEDEEDKEDVEDEEDKEDKEDKEEEQQEEHEDEVSSDVEGEDIEIEELVLGAESNEDDEMLDMDSAEGSEDEQPDRRHSNRSIPATDLDEDEEEEVEKGY
ncbi:hypothetical protein LTR17_003350 [Elasticomyces elasticus]|nr:hypothetical protein LTR17_003350 [Elasticomyces elasticus]